MKASCSSSSSNCRCYSCYSYICTSDCI